MVEEVVLAVLALVLVTTASAAATADAHNVTGTAPTILLLPPTCSSAYSPASYVAVRAQPSKAPRCERSGRVPQPESNRQS